MKTSLPYFLGVLGAATLLLLVSPAPSQGQSASDAAIYSVADDLTAQQATLVANQAKIDQKIAEIAEEVRQARLFVARGGGHK